MKNNFYNEFDQELQGRRNPDYRTPFQQDRDRIIYTSAFRRLQAKTQVFSVGEYDFYRNRLTHSLEVAQIGRSICNYLEEHDGLLSAAYYVDSDLVEAICLAHDLGHPPFGHAGERTLHEVMQEWGGFEGNAQTLRLMTETIFSRRGKRTGLRPTRALLDGVMKYKSLFREVPGAENHFLYDDQEVHRGFLFGGRPLPEDLPPGKALNAFRSLECQIMDWADDTAYSLNDLTDGIRAGVLSEKRMEDWAAGQALDLYGEEAVSTILRILAEGDIELTISSEIGRFIRAVRLRERKTFVSDQTNRYRYELMIEEPMRARADWFGKMATDLVFRTARLQQLEYKGRRLLRGIFECYHDVYLDGGVKNVSLLPAHWEKAVQQAPDEATRARLLCDYIAGMTDGFAIRTYKRLHDPEFGSIVDIV